MKLLIAALCLMFTASSGFAQEKRAPSPAEKKQQERMKACKEKAAAKKAEERTKWTNICLKRG